MFLCGKFISIEKHFRHTYDSHSRRFANDSIQKAELEVQVYDAHRDYFSFNGVSTVIWNWGYVFWNFGNGAITMKSERGNLSPEYIF